MKLLILLLFPICAIAQDQGRMFKADLYTLTVLEDTAICEKNRVLWGQITEEKRTYFCFMLEDNEGHCFELGPPRRQDSDVVIYPAVDERGELYGVSLIVSEDGMTVWVAHAGGKLPAWVLSTHNICSKKPQNKLPLNFLKNEQRNN